MKNNIKNVRKLFGIVSDALLVDKSLSPTSRLVGAWIEGRSADFVILPWYLINQLGISKDAWQKARRELINAGYLTPVTERKNGQFQAVGYNFQVPMVAPATAGFTGAGFSSSGETGPGKTGPIPIGVGPTGQKPRKPPPRGGGEVAKSASSQPPQPQQLRLSDLLGISGAQAAALDQLAQGASAEQLGYLMDARAVWLAAGKIKNEAGWLAQMARKAAAGAITTPKPEEAGGASVKDQLVALSLPPGTVIAAGSGKQLIIDHMDGAPRVLADGLWLGAQRSLRVLQRVHAGELMATQPVPGSGAP